MQPRQEHKRFQFLQKMRAQMRAHWSVKLVGAIWFVLSVVSTVVTYGPPQWQQRVSLVRYVPHWPWYWWALGLLAILLVFFFEAAYNVYTSSEAAETGDSRQKTVSEIPALAPARVEPKSNLRIFSTGFNWVGVDIRHIWSQTAQDQCVGMGLLAMVRNSPAPTGEVTGTAHSAAVSLEFFGGSIGGTLGSIPRAYWLGSSENEVTISAGEQKAILVGVFRGETIEIYNNPRKYGVVVPRRAALLRNWSFPQLESGQIPFDQFIDVGITIVNGKTGETYLYKKVRFKHSATEPKLEMTVLD
jgi:hypothetical protein